MPFGVTLNAGAPDTIDGEVSQRRPQAARKHANYMPACPVGIDNYHQGAVPPATLCIMDHRQRGPSIPAIHR